MTLSPGCGYDREQEGLVPRQQCTPLNQRKTAAEGRDATRRVSQIDYPYLHPVIDTALSGVNTNYIGGSISSAGELEA